MTETARIRALLSESAQHRARGDLGAAVALETMAIVTLRAIRSTANAAPPKRRPARRRARA